MPPLWGCVYGQQWKCLRHRGHVQTEASFKHESIWFRCSRHTIAAARAPTALRSDVHTRCRGLQWRQWHAPSVARSHPPAWPLDKAMIQNRVKVAWHLASSRPGHRLGTTTSTKTCIVDHSPTNMRRVLAADGNPLRGEQEVGAVLTLGRGTCSACLDSPTDIHGNHVHAGARQDALTTHVAAVDWQATCNQSYAFAPESHRAAAYVIY